MWYLTNNRVEFEGHTFVQVKRKLPNGKFEFGGYVDSMLPIIRGDFWIGEGSYLFCDCEVNGRVRIHKNCVIKNSQLLNNVVVRDDCVITNSTINSLTGYNTVFDKQCQVNDVDIFTIGKYTKEFFQDGAIEKDTYNGVILLMTPNYCRVNCLNMTYEQAWEYLRNQKKWDFIKSKHPDMPQIYYPDTVKWLYYWCEKQLKRKQGRAK